MEKIAKKLDIEYKYHAAQYRKLAKEIRENTTLINGGRGTFDRNIADAKNAMQDALVDMGKDDAACLISGIAPEDQAAMALISSIKSGNAYGQKIAMAALACCAGVGNL